MIERAAATFPRAARLLKAADFARLRGAARALGSASFSIRIARNEAETARLGLAVSKRVCKRAVARNRIKRLARDSFRRHRHALPNVDILLIARPAAAAADNAALHAELEAQWQRIAALNRIPGPVTMRA